LTENFVCDKITSEGKIPNLII